MHLCYFLGVTAKANATGIHFSEYQIVTYNLIPYALIYLTQQHVYGGRRALNVWNATDVKRNEKLSQVYSRGEQVVGKTKLKEFSGTFRE